MATTPLAPAHGPKHEIHDAHTHKHTCVYTWYTARKIPVAGGGGGGGAATALGGGDPPAAPVALLPAAPEPPPALVPVPFAAGELALSCSSRLRVGAGVVPALASPLPAVVPGAAPPPDASLAELLPALVPVPLPTALPSAPLGVTLGALAEGDAAAAEQSMAFACAAHDMLSILTPEPPQHWKATAEALPPEASLPLEPPAPTVPLEPLDAFVAAFP